ncbi:hypothetical protein CKM354_001105100 [Cercospora kikuchii]|uniref:Heterokaryon incompatibility domain-containing protein n=1 Tax=Cercospora kikuchii TaxID=84275 RepID=A0A9P3CST2_9PEZI|nr:uncharacterized protein CKM354_001105100 [Cercospora kikuchii]GIZ47976.1 hypothetical protein CKM354_001105100 [Cercospora kikuchii]
MSLHIGEQDAAELDHDRERGDAVTTSPEHADPYIYEPLPGDRWIRVLVLEPAPELDCPLVARLEVLHLGPALPMKPISLRRYGKAMESSYEAIYPSRYEPTDDEKQQHEAHVSLVNARRLPYTAVSYSWAMDDGDDSLCRVLTLHGKQVSITQNLSEGLRRIRYEHDSQRLWVDALCIDQQNTTERSAQVAMMADIFELAERCIVWLGEDLVRDNDLAVWQLSHCLVPNDNPEAFDRLFGHRNGNAAIVVLNSLMAVDDSQCTMQACSERHTRIDDADLAGELFYVDVGEKEFSDKTLKEFWLYLLAAPPETVARKLSGIGMWMQRRYWKRRWIVQESASRTRSSGATDYCWAEFSVSHIGMQNMLQLLASIADSIQIFLRRTGLFTRDVTDALSIKQAGVDPRDDLCDHLCIYASMQCSDERDYLYSLVTLDPSYGVQVDYTLSMREVCIEFSRLMVRKGEFRRLLGACDSQRENFPTVQPALDLPSWVLDLRLYCDFTHRYGNTAAHEVVCTSSQLSLELHLVGSAVGFEKLPGKWPRAGPRSCLAFKPHGLDFTSMWRGRWGRPPTLLVNFEFNDHSAEIADTLYCDDAKLPWKELLLLRPVNTELSMYRLIKFEALSGVYSADGKEIVDWSAYTPRKDSLKTLHIV